MSKHVAVSTVHLQTLAGESTFGGAYAIEDKAKFQPALDNPDLARELGRLEYRAIDKKWHRPRSGRPSIRAIRAASEFNDFLTKYGLRLLRVKDGDLVLP